MTPLLILVALRVPHLDNPLFGVHDHRLNESAAIARNFHDFELDITRPRIDWGGAGPGYIEEAFQLYTFTVALLYRVFGVHEAIGRGVSLVATLATGLLLWDLVRRIASRRAADLSLLFFALSPLGIYFGTSFQQDAVGTLLMTATVWAMLRHVENGAWGWLAASFAAATLSGLLKPPNLHVGLPLVYLCYRSYGWGLLRRAGLLVYAVLIGVLPTLWFVHAHRLGTEYGNSAMGDFSMFGSLDLRENWQLVKVLGVRAALQILAPPGLVLVAVGVVAWPRARNFVLHAWLAGFMLVAFLTAGAQRPHNYYQLPMTVVFAGLAGLSAERLLEGSMPVLSRLRGKAVGAIIVGLVGVASFPGSFWTLRSDFPEVARARPIAAMARRVQELTPEGSLIVVGGHAWQGAGSGDRHRDPDGMTSASDPIELYQSHRKGWFCHMNTLTPERLKSFATKGASYFISWRMDFLGWYGNVVQMLDAGHELVERSPEWVIYRLRR